MHILEIIFFFLYHVRIRPRVRTYKKLRQKKKGQIFVSAAPKIVSFSQLPAVKNSIFGAAKSKLDLSYFFRALV